MPVTWESIMRARYLSIFAAVCGLAGCVEETADPGKYMWARPGATHQQFQSDTDECRRKVHKALIDSD